MTSGTDVGAGEEPTSVAQQTKSNVESSPESVVITAEIPLVPQSRPRRISVAGDGWYAAQPERRAPAPVAIQLVVWLLFFLFLIGLAGLLVEHFHPSWLEFLRYKPAQSSPHHPAAGAANDTTSSTRPPSASGFALTSSSPSGVTYSVPSPSKYTLVVAAANPCYVAVKVPPKSSHYVYARTITQAESPVAITVSGSSSLMLGARATTVTVEVNAKRVGTISAPRSAFTYTFVPSAQ